MCNLHIVDEKLTPERVTLVVKEFWQAFSSGSPARLTALYFPDATLFGVEGSRAELARLALARREREYFNHGAKVTVQTGLIDVRMLSDNTALTTYGFQFRASNVGSASGKATDRTITHGRATQISYADRDGKVVILHEHLSSADIKKD